MSDVSRRPPGRRADRPRRGRAGPAVLVLCTVVGVWLGLTGPTDSPVQPDPATVQVGQP